MKRLLQLRVGVGWTPTSSRALQCVMARWVARLRSGRVNMYFRRRAFDAAAQPPLAKAPRSVLASKRTTSANRFCSVAKTDERESGCTLFRRSRSHLCEGFDGSGGGASARRAHRTFYSSREPWKATKLAGRKPNYAHKLTKAAGPLARRPGRLGRLELHGGMVAAHRSLRIFRQSRRPPCRGEAGA